jgi:hypothetical protein
VASKPQPLIAPAESSKNVEDGFYVCPTHGFSTSISPYVPDVPGIWGFGRQFGSRNAARWTRNFSLAREAPYPKPARLPTSQYECKGQRPIISTTRRDEP